MQPAPHSPAPSPAPGTSRPGPSRRTLLVTAGWTAPAITLATAAPAFAVSTTASRLANNAPLLLKSRTGIAGLRVTVTSATGRPVPGETVLVTLPTTGGPWQFGDGSTTKVVGPTDAAGAVVVPAIRSDALATNNRMTATTLTVSLVSDPAVTTTVRLQRDGAYLGGIVSGFSQTHTLWNMGGTHYAVGAQLVLTQSTGPSGTTLYHASLSSLTELRSFVWSAVADPVQVGGTTLFSLTDNGTVATDSTTGYGTPTRLSTTSTTTATLVGAGAYTVGSTLYAHDLSGNGAPAAEITTGTRNATTRRTTDGRRTIGFVDGTGGGTWRDGTLQRLSHVPTSATSVGEDAFLVGGELVIGEQVTGVGSVSRAYAAVAPGTQGTTVWFTRGNEQLVRRPDGSVTSYGTHSPTGGNGSSPVPLGYGYYRDGNTFYREGVEIFWGSSGGPVVTASGVSFFGIN